MKTLSKGLLSLRDLCALLVLFVSAATSLSASSSQEELYPSNPSHTNWQVTMPIDCTGDIDWTVSFSLSAPFDYTAVLSDDQTTLVFSVTATAEAPIPSNQHIAQISIASSSGNCNQVYNISTDGGGILIAMDEF